MSFEVKFLIQYTKGKKNHIRFSVMKSLNGGGWGRVMGDFIDELPYRIANKFEFRNFTDVNFVVYSSTNYALYVGETERGIFSRILQSFEPDEFTVEDRSRNVVCIYHVNSEQEVKDLVEEIIDSIPEAHDVRGETLARTTGIVEKFQTYHSFFENDNRGVEAGNTLGILHDTPEFVEGAKWPLALIRHHGKTVEYEFEFLDTVEDHGQIEYQSYGAENEKGIYTVDVEFLKGPDEISDIFWDTLEYDEYTKKNV